MAEAVLEGPSKSTERLVGNNILLSPLSNENDTARSPEATQASALSRPRTADTHSPISPSSALSGKQGDDLVEGATPPLGMKFPYLEAEGPSDLSDTTMSGIDDRSQQGQPSDILVEDLLQLPNMIESGMDEGIQSFQDLTFQGKQELQYGGLDMMEYVFLTHTCKILSIHDDPAANPWRSIMWPLAQKSVPVRHAICAMACFHMSKYHPGLQVHGMEHVQRAVSILCKDIDSNTLDLEESLATNIAISIAEGWNYRHSLGGSNYLENSRTMMRAIIFRKNVREIQFDELERLRFFFNTWLYIDSLARFTTRSHMPFDEECVSACNQIFFNNEQMIDPLMGCATAMFPMLGRLADLIRRVRTQPKPSFNSLKVISEATELRREFENWTSPLNLDSIDDPASTLTDSIQIAEAYRWAALLLLAQTAPEVPSRRSFNEIARKVFTYLATIPVTSHTAIVQIFPLMTAGCEAQGEDREWVRQRWAHISQRMLHGITDRLVKVTEETWSRRDEYETHYSAGPSDSYLSFNFPTSAAFKMGIDPVTRAGYIEYTVKGNLHWLEVMHEWEWEGESGQSVQPELAFVLIQLRQLCFINSANMWSRATWSDVEATTTAPKLSLNGV